MHPQIGDGTVVGFFEKYGNMSLAADSSTREWRLAAASLPTLTKAPKMLLMAATDGSGTLKIANWRFSLLGMSFLPPPGMFMPAKYLQQPSSQ